MNAMNKKLYVGSLPYSVTEDELREMFAEFGEIASARIITDKVTGLSKGFGFVEMSNNEEAQKAIEGMNGKQVNGRTLIVNEARPEQRSERSDRPFSRGSDRGGGGGWGGGERRGGGGGGGKRFSRGEF